MPPAHNSDGRLVNLFLSRSNRQGLTIINFSAQRKRFCWDKGRSEVVSGVFMAVVEGC